MHLQSGRQFPKGHMANLDAQIQPVVPTPGYPRRPVELRISQPTLGPVLWLSRHYLGNGW